MADDHYHLLNGERGQEGFNDVGTDKEQAPLQLKEVLSYDEIKLSALLSVSSHTDFINDGRRSNAGRVETNLERIERGGVVVGIIGGRFERPNVMEWQDVLVTKEQNTLANGYGQQQKKDQEECSNRAIDYRHMWTRFYEEPQDFLYDEMPNVIDQNADRFFAISHHGKDAIFFDRVIMQKRYAISFDTLLLDAEARAKAADQLAYVHVVGIGLGVWRIDEQQVGIFLETFAQRMKAMLPRLLHVGVVHFSWFHVSEWKDLKDGGIFPCADHPNGGIRTFLRNRNPGDKLPIEFEGMLPVISYAWDGNALPGNEFWDGDLTSTGDTSTACSTLISELHNGHINEAFVSGDNLHIASPAHGIEHIQVYSDRLLHRE